MKKNGKKLIILLIILVTVLMVIIYLFSKAIDTNKNKSNTNENTNQFKDEEIIKIYENKGKYDVNVINDDYIMLNQDEIYAIDDLIDLVVGHINSKNYSQLYRNLTQDYANVRFDTLEKFQVYLDETFPLSDYKCLSYRIDKSVCYIKLSAAGSQEVTEIKVNNFKDIENLKLYFEDIKQIQPISIRFLASKVQIEAKYIIQYSDRISLYTEIFNNSDKPAEILFKNVNLIRFLNGVEKKIDLIPSEELNVEANNKIQTELDFDEKDLTFSLDYMDAEIEVDGTSYSIRIPITYEDEE